MPRYFNDENIRVAASLIEDYLSKENWKIVEVKESKYRLLVIAEKNNEIVRLGIDVPKNGLISHIILEQAASEIALSQFKKDFC